MSHTIMDIAGQPSRYAFDYSLVGSDEEPLRQLSARTDHWGEIKIYAKVVMTAQHMADCLPRRCQSVRVGGDTVELWGEWVTAIRKAGTYDYEAVEPHARWSGIEDWSAHPMHAFLAPLVARASSGMISDHRVRALLMVTGFLDDEAGPMDVLRFLAKAA